MKTISRIFIVIAFVSILGCTYEYHMPDIHVDFRFKIGMDDICRTLVDNHGYQYVSSLNGAYKIKYYNTKNEIIGEDNYNNDYYEQDRIFTAPRDCEYFEFSMDCYGMVNDHTPPELVCTFIIKQQITGLSDARKGVPYEFYYKLNSISRIENINNYYKLYLSGFSPLDKIAAVKEVGYELLSNETYLYTYSTEGEVKNLGRFWTEGQFGVHVDEIGMYCDCYGSSGLVCRIYSKVESSEYIQKNSSLDKPYQFEIDRIEYFIEKKYNLYLSGFSPLDKIAAVEKVGYELLSNETFLYTSSPGGEVINIGRFWTEGKYSIDNNEVGLYCDCYGKSNMGDEVLVCRIFSKVESSEYIQDNSSSEKPYQFKIDRIIYMVDDGNIENQYKFNISFVSGEDALADYGYTLNLQKNFVLLIDNDGKEQVKEETTNLSHKLATDQPFIKCYSECYATKFWEYNKLICTIYYEQESAEFLESNSTSSSPYKLKIAKIEYHTTPY